MKKTLLALAITALSANAFAADVDFSGATAVGKNNIPNELTFSNSLTTTDTLTWALGTAIPDTQKRYIRVNLSENALFGTIPNLTLTGTTVTAAPVAGGANQNFVVFEVLATTDVLATAKPALRLGGLILTGKADVTASYAVYAASNQAITQAGALSSKAAGTYVSFVDGLVANVDVTKATTQKAIDVAATPTTTKFVGNVTQATIGALRVAIVENAVDYTMTSFTTPEALIGTASKLVVTGDFSAATKAANGQPALDQVKLGFASANALTATTATFDVPAIGVGAAGTPGALVNLTYTVDGKTAITPSAYNATLNIGAKVGSSIQNTTRTLGKVGELAKNGSTAFVDLALTPAGAYQNFVRITNKTNVAGNVFVKLFNDEGKSVEFPLSAVAGQKAALEAQASTAQLDINDIYAAARATDATFTVSEGRNKLRLVVTGEFAGAADDQNGISVQSYTVSKNGNSFATF